jgi:HK97 family phage prohead protease
MQFKSCNVEFKASKSKRLISGYASKWDVVDLGGDLVRTGAYAKTLQERAGRIAFLWQHDARQPLGVPTHLEEDSTGLAFEAKVSNTRLGDEALELADDGAVQGVSIGYSIDESDHIEVDGRQVHELKALTLYEFSLVTFPMNEEARVEAVQKWLPLELLDGIKKGTLTDIQTIELGRFIDALKSLLPRQVKAVIPYRSYPTSQDDWDGPTEIAAADVEDLALMSAWVDSENPDIKAAYKLPHHRADDKYIVWNGLTAAMGALLGARGGVDIPDVDRVGVYNHLSRHYREDFDEEPPEYREASALHDSTVCPVEKGESLGSLLNGLIDDEVEDGAERSEVLAAMGRAGGIEAGTVNQILDGTINCPPLRRLEGFADELGVDVSRLVDAAERDGCDYTSPNEAHMNSRVLEMQSEIEALNKQLKGD